MAGAGLNDFIISEVEQTFSVNCLLYLQKCDEIIFSNNYKL